MYGHTHTTEVTLPPLLVLAGIELIPKLGGPVQIACWERPQHVQTPEAVTAWQGAIWYKPKPCWGHAIEITRPKHAGSCGEGCTARVMELHTFSKDTGWYTFFLDRNLYIHQLLPFHWIDESCISQIDFS